MAGHTKLHGLGNTEDHTSTTLAGLNALISDANLVDSGDLMPLSGGVFTGEVTYYGNYDGATTNTAYGTSALFNTITGSQDNVAIGYQAGQNITTGDDNIIVGTYAGDAISTGDGNTCIGNGAGSSISTQNDNTAIGDKSQILASGTQNTSVGSNTLNVATGAGNTAIGLDALRTATTPNYNTALGRFALRYTTTAADFTTYTNCTGLGNNTQVSNSNQVQLGNSSTTTYAFGAVQDRSDIRDKADVIDTTLGLDFINSLRPVDFKWDMRDDYHVIDDETGEMTILEKDGSKKRNRYHHGFIAQEVEETIYNKGIDFGGYQDHSINGGDDVKSLGYNEFIAPIVKALQELSQENAELKARLEALENA